MDARGTGTPPAWLIVATGLLALGSLVMALAETNLWLHYLIDAGEYISLAGVGFILAAGIYLFRRGRLLASLPLSVPWLLFPVITQGDQIIDNLSINWMRLITHVLLGLLFGTPVAIAVMAAKHWLAPKSDEDLRHVPRWLAIVPGLPQIAAGRVREGAAMLAAMLLVAEMWAAVAFLGLLMVVTLALMVWGVLAIASMPIGPAPDRRRGERFALGVLVASVVTSLALFVGFKNRPGAYQGSPSHFMDPAQKDGGFRLDRVSVPSGPVATPADPDGTRRALTGYARALEKLLSGYYVLDRNYNYDFHNRLFLRNTPLLPDYRTVGLTAIGEAEHLRADADAATAAVHHALRPDDPLGALLEDVHAYAAFTFERAPVLTRMSAEFETTQAGLQHATHVFEGEGKMLSVQLNQILIKHSAVLDAPAVRPVTSEFLTIGRSIRDAYANRIVGF
jgi:hypothetical protein